MDKTLPESVEQIDFTRSILFIIFFFHTAINLTLLLHDYTLVIFINFHSFYNINIFQWKIWIFPTLNTWEK